MALIFRKLVFLTLVVCLSTSAFAQTPSSPTAGEVHAGGGPRRQLATILFAGLGGAVLGLSTLSFYGRPQDKLANIAIGFAGGVIIGTAFVTYRAATNPAEFYGQTKPELEDEIERNRPHVQTAPRAPLYTLNFEF
jgi:hypothetical protein